MTPAVIASDLVVAYGTRVAIATSTFSIPSGRVTAVIGPNGSGKSTLLSTIAGLVDPASGGIEVPAAKGQQRRIAYVLQSTKVNEALPISVREIVRMGRYASSGNYGRLTAQDHDAVDAAMRRLNISDLADRHLSELSGGQRQRVFVAQGLAQDHDVLLLDEPMTGIDLPTAQAIDSVIHDEAARGCTVVMTTHDLSEAQIAENVLLLAGRIIACGAPEEVLTKENLLAAYGPALLHFGDDDSILLDDPAHMPIAGRHAHRERTIHTETSPSDRHTD